MNHRVFLPIAAALLLFNAGCAFQQSNTARTVSFEPHAGRKIGQDDVETFLASRTAFLLSSDHIPTNEWRAGNLHFPDVSGFGCAAAIDARGYFLTASHCLSHKETFLIFYDLSRPATFVRRARVVWQGNPHKGQPDLAILHVNLNQALDHTFDWAGEIHRNDPAMAAGIARSETNSEMRVSGFAFLGGNILDFEDSNAKERDLRVATDLPLQPGDSGGPLVDTDGRLIGVNVQGTPPFVHRILPKLFFPMVADRPNLKWLHETIEADAANRAVNTTSRTRE